jgi:hypothetical protein
MHIRITRSFISELSPRPLLLGELLDIPDDIATKWIAESKAQLWTLTGVPIFVSPTPPKSKREKAVRA